MTDQNRLRIAIQKKGRLSEESIKLLKAAGIKFSMRDRVLIAHSTNQPIDLLLVRDDDIPGLVMDGIADLGFIGENELEEKMLERKHSGQPYEYKVLRRMEYGDCRLSIAVPNDFNYENIQSMNGTRIATSYPQLLQRYLNEQDVDAKTIMLAGSVEVAPLAGVADAICDLVSSGATLEANGLKEVDIFFRSKATLIQRAEPLEANKVETINTMMPRVNSVIQAKESKYIMLHAPLAKLEEVKTLLPGAENPTVLPLAGSDNIVAIHVVSPETLFWETMEDLKALGCSSILVLPIEKMMG